MVGTRLLPVASDTASVPPPASVNTHQKSELRVVAPVLRQMIERDLTRQAPAARVLELDVDACGELSWIDVAHGQTRPAPTADTPRAQTTHLDELRDGHGIQSTPS